MEVANRAYFRKNFVLYNEGLIGGDHGERGTRAYNRGLGQSPQRSSGVEPLVRRSWAKPPEADDIFILKVHFLRSSCGILRWCNGCMVHQILKLHRKL